MPIDNHRYILGGFQLAMFDYQRLPPLSSEGTVKVPNSGTGTATVAAVALPLIVTCVAWPGTHLPLKTSLYRLVI